MRVTIYKGTSSSVASRPAKCPTWNSWAHEAVGCLEAHEQHGRDEEVSEPSARPWRRCAESHARLLSPQCGAGQSVGACEVCLDQQDVVTLENLKILPCRVNRAEVL